MAERNLIAYDETLKRMIIPGLSDAYVAERPIHLTENLSTDALIDGRDIGQDGSKLDFLTITGPVDMDTIEAEMAFITVTQPVNLDTLATRVDSLDASVVLMGTWDMSVNLYPVSTKAGESWIISVAGNGAGIDFDVNDRVVALIDGASQSNATHWHKLDYTDEVLSVAGRVGAVELVEADISDLQVYLQAIDIDSLSKLNAIVGESLIIDSDPRLTLSSTALQKDGSTALTGNWNALASITGYTWESTASSGTPPFVVASNTLVSNLNAALLEGNAASAFAPTAHTHVAPINTPVVAYATGGQANATELVEGSNLVTTVVTDGDSVKLPDIALGKDVHVVNMGAAFLDLFPNASSAIEFSAPNVAMSVSPQGTVNLRRIDNINWVRV